MGLFDPEKAFNCLNDLQREQDPQAYKSETLKMYQFQESNAHIENQLKSQKVIQANETDKALFDFDEEIDNLN